MSIINHLPFPIYVGSLLIFMEIVVWGTIKGFRELRSSHFILPVIEALILGILLIIYRTSTEFNIFVSFQPIFQIFTFLILAVLLINILIVAIPKIHANRSLQIFFIINGIVLILIICFVILAVKFPNVFN